MEEKLVNIPIEQLEANKHQPRTYFDDKLLDELAISIKEHGIVQPIVVRKITENMYEIIAGERRYRAAQRIGLKDVPVIVKEYSESQTAAIALIENIQRDDLSVIEEAAAYKKLIVMHGLTQEELAEKLGKSQSTLANKIRLLQLAPVVLEKLKTKEITERHGRAFLMIKEDAGLQVEVLKKVLKKKLNVKDTEKLIKKLFENDEENIEKVPLETRTKITSKISPQMKLVFNTYEQTNDMVKKMGVEPLTEYEETPNDYIITVKIPKGN